MCTADAEHADGDAFEPAGRGILTVSQPLAMADAFAFAMSIPAPADPGEKAR